MPEPPVDMPTLQNLVATTDAAFVQELIEAFLEDGREQIAAMRQSLASGDVQAFQRAAHSLKSSSASL
ncbi:MAG TPA: Hpt domain-containing protein, partial [Anaerolineales bacterium]